MEYLRSVVSVACGISDIAVEAADYMQMANECYHLAYDGTFDEDNEYLASQYYHHLTGSYLQEYAHGDDGVRQYYEKLLGTTDVVVWAALFHAAFDKHIERNEPCCCGSGRKFKKCHEPIVQSIQLIGKEQVEKDFKDLNVL